ncbi:MAG: TolC family protein, partial [Bacteroidota bacterium]
DEKEYYNLLNTSLKIPTWIGVEPKVEFDRNLGEFINDSNEIPDTFDFQQVSMGLSVPLGKGLFFDDRRNTIRQAQAFSQIALAEQTKEVNKILFTIIKDYWNWYLSFQKQELLRQAIDLAENIFERTLIDFEFGEAAVVDTLQAKINFQKRKVDYRKSLLEFQLARLSLSRHLWSENLVPLEINEVTIPDSLSLFDIPDESELRTAVETALENHPEINKIEGKQAQLNSDLRWRKESLKPEIDLSYSFIDAPLNPNFESTSLEFGENYKLGVDFSFPILLRKERGKLQETKIKLLTNEYELVQNQVNIKNNIYGRYAENVAFQGLLSQYQDVAENYRRLLEAEVINLQNGETDLFKLNIQQDKYLESRIAFYEAYVKLEKSKADYFHSTGVPYLGLTNFLNVAN